ncbi:MAG: heme biosynthesis HemY N-terminal domain-containing protein [Gammaproteobacteria bacterium]
MIRVLLIFIFFLIVFTAAVFFAMKAPGFAVFTYGNTTYELPLVEFVIGLFILFTLFYILLRLFALIFSAPKRIHSAMNKRRQNKAIDKTKQGQTKFTKGDWTQSEKLLLSGANHSSSASVNYIWAARAAHMRGDFTKRDAHLAEAKKSNPDDSSAVDVLHGELLLDQRMPNEALVSLSQYEATIHSNPKIAYLFANAYEQLGDWEKLADMLPQLENSKSISQQNYSRIENETIKGLLQNSQNASNVDEIGAKYRENISADEELTLEYVTALRQQGKHELAETIVSSALAKNWCSKLVRQYGLIELKDPSQALNKAEQWIEKHTNDANLYLTLGRICNKAQLWGKAKAYFESSLTRKPLAETYAELAALHEQLDELEDAHKCAKKGLKLATRST